MIIDGHAHAAMLYSTSMFSLTHLALNVFAH
jgi:hypothetical protein